MGNSFVADDLRERHSDIIWRLRLRGEEDRWVYLLLEFQSASDPFMALRLMTYEGLLLEQIIRREKLKPGDRLPLVLPLVLHSGKGRWRGPLRLESLFVPVPRVEQIASTQELEKLTRKVLTATSLEEMGIG